MLIRVHAAGIIPTELEWVPTNTTRDGTPRRRPLIPGHELSGVIAECGPDAGDLRVGEVTRLDVTVDKGKVTAYRARLNVSFKYER